MKGASCRCSSNKKRLSQTTQRRRHTFAACLGVLPCWFSLCKVPPGSGCGDTQARGICPLRVFSILYLLTLSAFCRCVFSQELQRLHAHGVDVNASDSFILSPFDAFQLEVGR